MFMWAAGQILHTRPVHCDDRLLQVLHLKDLAGLLGGVRGPSLQGANKRYRWPSSFWRSLPLALLPRSARRLEMKRGRWTRHSTKTCHSLRLSPRDACPYIKMWFGALTGTQQGEAGWEGLGLQCKPQSHSLPPASPPFRELYYIHCCCWCWCAICVCVLYV